MSMPELHRLVRKQRTFLRSDSESDTGSSVDVPKTPAPKTMGTPVKSPRGQSGASRRSAGSTNTVVGTTHHMPPPSGDMTFGVPGNDDVPAFHNGTDPSHVVQHSLRGQSRRLPPSSAAANVAIQECLAVEADLQARLGQLTRQRELLEIDPTNKTVLVNLQNCISPPMPPPPQQQPDQLPPPPPQLLFHGSSTTADADAAKNRMLDEINTGGNEMDIFTKAGCRYDEGYYIGQNHLQKLGAAPSVPVERLLDLYKALQLDDAKADDDDDAANSLLDPSVYGRAQRNLNALKAITVEGEGESGLHEDLDRQIQKTAQQRRNIINRIEDETKIFKEDQRLMDQMDAINKRKMSTARMQDHNAVIRPARHDNYRQYTGCLTDMHCVNRRSHDRDERIARHRVRRISAASDSDADSQVPDLSPMFDQNTHQHLKPTRLDRLWKQSQEMHYPSCHKMFDEFTAAAMVTEIGDYHRAIQDIFTRLCLKGQPLAGLSENDKSTLLGRVLTHLAQDGLPEIIFKYILYIRDLYNMKPSASS